MNRNHSSRIKRAFRQLGLILLSFIVVFLALQLVEAGNLNPSAAPASTMKTLQNIYDVMASTSYDSSGVTANVNGNALEIMKCAIQKIRTGSCP